MKRIFVAIDITDEARAAVAMYISMLRSAFPEISVKWERPEKLHLTLKFIGNVDQIQLKKLQDSLASMVGHTHRFGLIMRGTGAFVDRKKSQVLWLGIGDSISNPVKNRLETIFADVNNNCWDVGIAGRRKFKPHLTIARIKESTGNKALVDRHLNSKFEPVEFEVSEIVVYESKLLLTGSVYTVVSRHPLS